MWKSVIHRRRKKPLHLFGFVNASMCTCMELNSNGAQTTSRQRLFTLADQSNAHGLKRRCILRLQPCKFKVNSRTSIAESCPLSLLSQTAGPAKPSTAHNNSDDFVRFVVTTATPTAMKTREIEEVSEEDE